PPGVNDISRGQKKADLGVGGNDQPLVDFEQIVVHAAHIDTRADLARPVAVAIDHGVEIDAVFEVFVLPQPLIAGDLDVDVGAAGVLHVDQDGGGGNGENHQNHDRNRRPGDLGGGGV